MRWETEQATTPSRSARFDRALRTRQCSLPRRPWAMGRCFRLLWQSWSQRKFRRGEEPASLKVMGSLTGGGSCRTTAGRTPALPTTRCLLLPAQRCCGTWQRQCARLHCHLRRCAAWARQELPSRRRGCSCCFAAPPRSFARTQQLRRQRCCFARGESLLGRHPQPKTRPSELGRQCGEAGCSCPRFALASVVACPHWAHDGQASLFTLPSPTRQTRRGPSRGNRRSSSPSDAAFRCWRARQALQSWRKLIWKQLSRRGRPGSPTSRPTKRASRPLQAWVSRSPPRHCTGCHSAPAGAEARRAPTTRRPTRPEARGRWWFAFRPRSAPLRSWVATLACGWG
mmetsp:Transcript_1694/g.6765  ORF Transcript_1694/g.6765 Transcript_1694/m.6765 type:complete len:341 (-) Transcript_1694:11832-12854(-)